MCTACVLACPTLTRPLTPTCPSPPPALCSQEDQRLFQALECCGAEVVGAGGSWAAPLDSGLVNNLGRYRRYDYASLRDLLRVIRNKHSHFREMPGELQRKLGPIPDGFLRYFCDRRATYPPALHPRTRLAVTHPPTYPLTPRSQPPTCAGFRTC